MCAWLPGLYCLLGWPFGPRNLITLTFDPLPDPDPQWLSVFRSLVFHYMQFNPVVVSISLFCFAFSLLGIPWIYALISVQYPVVTEGNFERKYLRWFVSWIAWQRLLFSQTVRDFLPLKQRYTKKPQYVAFLLRFIALRARTYLHIYNFIICVISQLYFQCL